MVHFVVSDEVHKEDLTSMYPYSMYYKDEGHNGNHKYFVKEKGEHYKLISYLSRQCPDGSTVIDIGTFLGFSALALANNQAVSVVTYDIAECVVPPRPSILDVSNIEYRVKDCMEDIELLLDAPLVVLDVDPHDGVQEKHMIGMLLKHGYKGLVLCDDIHLNSGMKNFWDWVPMKKIDLTEYGHFSGTGVIIFDPSVHDLEKK